MKGRSKCIILLVFCKFHNYLSAQPIRVSVKVADFFPQIPFLILIITQLMCSSVVDVCRPDCGLLFNVVMASNLSAGR